MNFRTCFRKSTGVEFSNCYIMQASEFSETVWFDVFSISYQVLCFPSSRRSAAAAGSLPLPGDPDRLPVGHRADPEHCPDAQAPIHLVAAEGAQGGNVSQEEQGGGGGDATEKGEEVLTPHQRHNNIASAREVYGARKIEFHAYIFTRHFFVPPIRSSGPLRCPAATRRSSPPTPTSTARHSSVSGAPASSNRQAGGRGGGGGRAAAGAGSTVATGGEA